MVVCGIVHQAFEGLPIIVMNLMIGIHILIAWPNWIQLSIYLFHLVDCHWLGEYIYIFICTRLIRHNKNIIIFVEAQELVFSLVFQLFLNASVLLLWIINWLSFIFFLVFLDKALKLPSWVFVRIFQSQGKIRIKVGLTVVAGIEIDMVLWRWVGVLFTVNFFMIAWTITVEEWCL